MGSNVTDVLDNTIEVEVTRNIIVADLQPGDILSDGRIVEGRITGDGGTIVSFKAERKLVDCACAYREHNELEPGDELVFEDEGVVRTLRFVGGKSEGFLGGTSEKGTSVMFEGDDDDCRVLPNTDGPSYPIVVR